jgi:hypothetical protein
METEGHRRLVRRGLLYLAVAWALHALVDFGSFDLNHLDERLLLASLGFALFSLAGAVRIVRSTEATPGRALLLLAAAAACADAAVFFFYHRPRVLRMFGGFRVRSSRSGSSLPTTGGGIRCRSCSRVWRSPSAPSSASSTR